MRLSDADELFGYRLGSAMTMEQDSLAQLEMAEKSVIDSRLKTLLQHHQDETRGQIDSLRECFSLLGIEVKEKPSPTSKGLLLEGTALLDKVDSALVDVVIVSTANCNEHLEVASYRGLITLAEGLGLGEVAEKLKQNLAQEEHTSAELEALLAKGLF